MNKKKKKYGGNIQEDFLDYRRERIQKKIEAMIKKYNYLTKLNKKNGLVHSPFVKKLDFDALHRKNPNLEPSSNF